MDYNNTKNQKIKRQLVGREVIHCASNMMQEISEHYADDDDYLALVIQPQIIKRLQKNILRPCH